MVKRRDLLKTGSLLAAGGIAYGSPAGATLSALAQAGRTLPVIPKLGSDQAVFIDRGSASAGKYAASFNMRTTRTPKLRALCKTPDAVAEMVGWAREHGIAFALRSGGHCFEGFSQSPELVIDTRLMNAVVFDPAEQTVQVGAGALLSKVYAVLSKAGHAIPAGTCQSVGIAGLALGGGVGYLARQAGLTCDAMESLECVDANGRILSVHTGSHSDLFWACRGGGGGSFGVATRFRFRTVPVRRVIVFEIDWVLAPDAAAGLMTAWQNLAPGAPDEISSILRLTKRRKGRVLVRLVGQSTGGEQQLQTWIRGLVRETRPWSPPRLRHNTFIEAANYFSSSDHIPTGFFKFKSDIVTSPLSQEAFAVLLEELEASPIGTLTLICEALGGAVSRVPASATAFPHRQGALFKLQYTTEVKGWQNGADNIRAVSRIHGAMRPYMSGAAYVNYCDTDIEDWSRAYWQSNLERLSAIKRAYDPDDVFRHGQSVPLR